MRYQRRRKRGGQDVPGDAQVEGIDGEAQAERDDGEAHADPSGRGAPGEVSAGTGRDTHRRPSAGDTEDPRAD